MLQTFASSRRCDIVRNAMRTHAATQRLAAVQDHSTQGPGAADHRAQTASPYETTHGGAPLSFSGRILRPEDIADAVVRALHTGKREISVPRSRGWLALLGELLPPVRARWRAGGRRRAEGK
jgi:hypothetical protein